MTHEAATAAYWQHRYENETATWDIGYASPALTAYTDQLPDKNISILIPGCGNGHEAGYLLQQGFTNITMIDIAETPVTNMRRQFAGQAGVTILQEDFFEHQGAYHLILEQTFLSALPLHLRPQYPVQMHQLLRPGGKLAGVLFDKQFEGGPPFGGSAEEYRVLFTPYFHIHTLGPCYNSIEPRSGSEVFFIAIKLTA
jgi:methyl halide transferase